MGWEGKAPQAVGELMCGWGRHAQREVLCSEAISAITWRRSPPPLSVIFGTVDQRLESTMAELGPAHGAVLATVAAAALIHVRQSIGSVLCARIRC